MKLFSFYLLSDSHERGIQSFYFSIIQSIEESSFMSYEAVISATIRPLHYDGCNHIVRGSYYNCTPEYGAYRGHQGQQQL